MMRYKEDVITFLLVATTFLFFVFTPGKETLGSAVQGFIIALIFFGFLPLGYHFLVLKKNAESFGLDKNRIFSRWLLIIPVIVVALLITVLCYRFFLGFQAAFILPAAVVEGSLSWLVGYELILVPVLVALYELFFRGFVQKSWLQKYWGGYAILAQSILFVAFLFLTASFSWALFPFMLFSLFSGFLVWLNGSLIQAWLANWLYLLLFDIFVLIMR